MTGPVETINIPSSKIRAAFEGWLQSEWRSGARLIVLEGLRGAGKTTLTKRPFSVDARQSVNISIDQFCREYIPLKVSYLEAVDQSALRTAMRAKLCSKSPAVVVEGPVAWPLIEPM
jgi:chloramphenicol 3-O-phosphotransferase